MKIQKIALLLLLTPAGLLSAEDAKKPPITMFARAGHLFAGVTQLGVAGLHAIVIKSIVSDMKESKGRRTDPAVKALGTMILLPLSLIACAVLYGAITSFRSCWAPSSSEQKDNKSPAVDSTSKQDTSDGSKNAQDNASAPSQS